MWSGARQALPPGGYGYGYDAVGNMTRNNGVAQHYDAANQIAAAGAITYTFDSNGQQTATSENGMPTWLYDAQAHTVGYNDLLNAATFQTTAGRQRATKAVVPAPAATAGGFRLSILGTGVNSATKGNDDSYTSGGAGAIAGALGSVDGVIIGAVVTVVQAVIANHQNAAAAFLSTHSGAPYGVYVQYQVNDAYHGSTKLISHCGSGDINGDTMYGPLAGPIMTGTRRMATSPILAETPSRIRTLWP